jgi:serine/threonine protein kinase
MFAISKLQQSNMKSTLATLILVCNVLCATSDDFIPFDLCGRSEQQAPAALQRCSQPGQSPPSPSASKGNICPVPYLTSHNLVDKGSEDKVLGEGGFGKVERRTLCASACVTEKNSIDCTNPISVAQKMFRDREDTQQNANQLLGLQREAQLMTRVACPSDPSLLEHPGRRYVVETYAIINDGSCSRQDPMSISMKVYQGGDLSSYLDKHKSTLHDCSAKTELALKIATGLQYIHAVGITHRDLHTGNVLFDNEGNPAIADFGISMNGTRKEKFLSISGNNEINVYAAVHVLVHPPEYVAKGHNVISDKSDMYSLGRLFEQILYDVDTVDEWKVKTRALGFGEMLFAALDMPLDKALRDERFLPISASTPCKVSVHSALTL